MLQQEREERREREEGKGREKPASQFWSIDSEYYRQYQMEARL